MARFSVSRYATYTGFIIVSTYILFLLMLPTRNLETKANIYTKTKIFPQNGNEETLENVNWKIEPLANVLISSTEIEMSMGKYILSDLSYSNGLGNQMFQIAALLTIAIENEAKLLIPENSSIRRAFNLQIDRNIAFVAQITYNQLINKFQDDRILITDCCSYRNLSNLFPGKSSNIVRIDGYFQNFRYFHPHHQRKIKSVFSFADPVKKLVDQFMESVAMSITAKSARMIETNVANDDQALEADPDSVFSSTMIVGVHIRHGIDISMNSRNRRHGHVDAPIDYYNRAIEQISRIYTNVAFIICSDDVSWVRRRLKLGKDVNHYICPGPREVDMAILASCDSVIISTGTFGWWGAYLNVNASPDVYYYKNWPRAESTMDKMLNKTEYFPDNWIALE